MENLVLGLLIFLSLGRRLQVFFVDVVVNVLDELAPGWELPMDYLGGKIRRW